MPELDRLPPVHRRTLRRVMVVSQLCLAVVTAVVVAIGYQHLNGNIADGEDIEHVAEQGPDGPLNILVMGSDSRGKGSSGRSDTTILVHVSADRKDAYGVSLPRDAIVDRPDCRVGGETVPGEDAVMFNTAFSVGGAQCTIQTVEALTGVYVHHFVTLDFDGFKDMVDAVGGVEMCLPEAVDDDEHDIHLDAGTQVLKGQDALNYVRERYVLSSNGDLGRMTRQQAFLASLVRKVMSAGTLSQPDKLYSFLDAATGSISVDEELDSVGSLAGLLSQFRDTGLAHIRFVTVPVEAYEPDPNRLAWAAEAEELWQRIQDDEPLGKDLAADSVGADQAPGSAQHNGGSSGNDKERADAGLCG